MGYENILLDRNDDVATVTIHRPAKRNALNVKTVEEIFHAFQTVQADSGVKAAILTGSGEKAFAAGADINELTLLDSVGGQRRSQRGNEILNFIENLGKPVIAAVNGAALGGGCELAMACTLRIASENARFGQPEVKLGLIPGYGGTYRLPRLVGKGRALEMLLTGDPISAEEALRIGLVNRVVPLAELLPAAQTLVGKITSNAPLALRYGVEAVNKSLETSREQGALLEASLFGQCCASEDMKEGTRAFLEKRAAKFQGT